MNYPMQELAIVGPIIFIVLMVIFPVIGIFAGWKRAAYWGGGNFLFYVIGLIVWITAHDAIAGMVKNLITPLLAGTGIQADITKIAASVAAPVFFILVMLVGNILLLINYYAWFKRVVKIGKFEKREIEKKKRKPRSLQYKIVNGAIGGVGLPLLLLPTSLSFTQAIMMTTTSATTRANNKFVSDLYNGLMGVSKSVSWFSYYGYTDTFADIDALFSAVNVATKEVTYIDVTTGEPKQGTAVDGLKDIVGTGLSNIIEETVVQDVDQIKDQIDKVVHSWNSLLDGDEATDGSRTDLTVIFGSENATTLVQQIINQNLDKEIEITPEMMGNDGPFGPDGTFTQVVNWYVEKEQRGEEMIAPIELTQNSYDNMNTMINNMFNVSQLSVEEYAQFRLQVDNIVDMFFVTKE